MSEQTQLPTLEAFLASLVVTSAPDDDCCPICYDDWDSGEIIETPCEHKFHRECLTSWTKPEDGTANKNTCPSCRRVLFSIPNGISEEAWRWHEEVEGPIGELSTAQVPDHINERNYADNVWDIPTLIDDWVATVDRAMVSVRQNLPQGLWPFSEEALEFAVTTQLMKHDPITLAEWAALSRYRRARIGRRERRDMSPEEELYIDSNFSSYVSMDSRLLRQLGRTEQSRATDLTIVRSRGPSDTREETIQLASEMIVDMHAETSVIFYGRREPLLLWFKERGRGSIESMELHGEWLVVHHVGNARSTKIRLDYETLT